jgi:hypothetical protein
VLLALFVPGAASARGPLAWAKAETIDTQPLTTVSCAPAICVAGDRRGHLLTTLHPGRGRWTRTRRAVGGTAALSCVSRSLCVGVDAAGIVTRRGSAWKRIPIGGFVELDAVSCAPAGMLCVAAGINNSDNDVFQNAPEVAVWRGPPDGWDTINLNGSGAMTGVSCPSRTLCVGAGGGYVAVSRDPADGRAATWLLRGLGAGTVRWRDAACASEALCVVTGDGAAAVTTDAGTNWKLTRLDADLAHVACASERLCLAAAPHKVLVSADPAAGAWSLARRSGGSDVACASASLCALVDHRGTLRYAVPRKVASFPAQAR